MTSAAPGAGIATANSPPLSLPLGFFIAGPIALIVLWGGMTLGASTLLTYYLLPADLAETHLATLGWITMVMFGALYQFTPVVFRTKLYSARLGRIQFALYVAGVVTLVASFKQMWTPGLGIGGSVVVLAVVLFLYNIARTLLHRAAWTLSGQYIVHALFFLAATVAIGLTYALDLHFHWFAIPQHALAAHVHLGIAGWLGLTLMGVTYQLVPMFALVHGHDQRLARANLWLVTLSLLVLFSALLLGHPRALIVAAATLLAAGEIAWAFDVYRMLRLRRRPLDLTQAHTIASTLALIATVPVGFGLLIHGPGSPTAQTRWYIAYALLALGGWFTLAIMGQYYKIVPFLVWHHRYSPLIGRERVPLLREMYNGRRARIAFLVYLIGFCGAVLALLAGSAMGLRAAATIALLGCVGWSWTLVEVLRPRRARTPSVAAGFQR